MRGLDRSSTPPHKGVWPIYILVPEHPSRCTGLSGLRRGLGVAWRGSLALGGGLEVIARLGDQCLARLCKSRRRGLCRRFLVSSGSLTALSGAGGVFGGPWCCLAGSLAFGGGGLEVIARLGVQDLARLCKCRRIGLWGRFLAPSESLTALSGAGGSLAGLGGVFGGAFYGRQGLWRRFLALA